MNQLKGFENKVHPEYSVAHIDSNLFVKGNEGKLATILVYMDDLILTSDDERDSANRREIISLFTSLV